VLNRVNNYILELLFAKQKLKVNIFKTLNSYL